MVQRPGGVRTRHDDADLRDLVVQVRTGSPTGSGFFVGEGLILTCAHVVRAAYESGSPPAVTWRGTTVTGAYVDVAAPGEYPDGALVAVSFEGHPVAVLDGQVAPHDQLYAFGHTDDVPDGDSIAGRMEGPAGGAEPLLRFAETQVRPGASGAPVLNLRTGAICGMVKSSRGRSSPVGGRAVPVDALLTRYPALRDRLRLRLELAAYLRAAAEIVNQRAPVYFRNRKARDHYLAPSLRVWPGPQAALEHAQKLGSFYREASGSDTAVNAERPSDVVSWIGMEARPAHTVIFGGPGSGKTVLLQLTAAELAQRALDQLHGGSPVEGLAPPVLLPVSRVAEIGIGAAVREAVLTLLDPFQTGDTAQEIARHLVESLGRGDITLLVDALDEGTDANAVAASLRSAVPDEIRVVLVTRPHMFVAGVLPFDDIAYFDMVGFDDKDRERFTRTWFGDQAAEADAVIGWLTADTSLAAATSSPLVTGLACVARETGSISAAFSRVELYRAVVRAVVARGVTEEIRRSPRSCASRGGWPGCCFGTTRHGRPSTRRNATKRRERPMRTTANPGRRAPCSRTSCVRACSSSRCPGGTRSCTGPSWSSSPRMSWRRPRIVPAT
ncbi:trypsin-like peptidase domain-containing protein [Phytohabitans flavus]|uniref:trypsin-like peptidase domain-containing protein n=1 Tax=Phytohabitans flavus TaxID=1076124 RepID=UPI00363688D3